MEGIVIPAPWLNFLVALGLGLLVGLERERSKGTGPGRRPAGIRTFSLSALLGALAQFTGGVVFLSLAVTAVLVLLAIAHWRRRTSDPGLTTHMGVLCVTILGGLAMSEPLLAAALAVSVAVIFASKVWLHSFVKVILSEREVHSGLMFAVATLIVWPQLPDRFLGPYQALNPHNIWLLVILFLAMSAMGHITQRALGQRELGQRHGFALIGLAAGFVSSTAFIGTMGARANASTLTLGPAVAGALFSTVATFIQMGILLASIAPGLLRDLAPALVAGALTAALYGSIFLWRPMAHAPSASPQNRPEVGDGDAFSILAALIFATLITLMAVLAAGLRAWLGEAGLLGATALAGFVDTHAAAMTIASLVAAGSIGPNQAIMPIIAAMTCNALAKIFMAFATGSTAFAWKTMLGLILSIAATWAGVFLF
jgi:uncharacterized membrane protein (DUF4010 family)